MRNINERYVTETYAEDGQLATFEVHCEPSFNFAYDVVDDIAENDPERRAMIWVNPEGEQHTFTFADMKRWSDKTASYLAGLGIGRGDFVMVILRRHYQFWFVALALAKLGAVMVPATFMLKEHDLEYRLNGADIKAVIATDAGDIAQVMDNVAEQAPTVQARILVASGGGGLTPRDEQGRLMVPEGALVGEALSGEQGICALAANRPGWHDFNTGVRAASEGFARRETLAADPMLMYFSSGTSGNPKMVLHDSLYALGHLITAKHWHNVRPDGVHFTIADTGWGKAVWGKFYGQWLMEACVFTYDFDRFHPSEILGLIGEHRITTLCCPPTMYRLMMNEGIDGYDLSSLEYSTTAGEALNPDLFEYWRDHTGLTIYEGFGQTETPLTIGNLTGSTPRAGSMGKPVPLYDVEIQREDGTRCNTLCAGPARRDLHQHRPASRGHHDGLLPQPREDRGRHARRLVPHRRHRLGGRGRLLLVRGAQRRRHQVERLPHRALRDRVGAAGASGRARVRRHRRARPRARRRGEGHGGAGRGRAGHRRADARAAGVGEAADGALQVPAHHRVRRQAAPHRQRQGAARGHTREG